MLKLLQSVGKRPDQVVDFCDAIGWPGLTVVQASPGTFDVECTGVLNAGYGMLGFKCATNVFFTGPRNTLFQTFCLIDKPPEHANIKDFTDHGTTFDYSTLVGLHAEKDFESFKMGPSGTLLVAVVPWNTVRDYSKVVEKMGAGTGEQMSIAMEKYNQLILDPSWYYRLCAAMRRRTFMPQPDVDGSDLDQLLALISETILSGVTGVKTRSFRESSSLPGKLVDIAYSADARKKLQLPQIVEMLQGNSLRTIQEACDKELGFGPMELLRLCRMQQVRRGLTHRPTNEDLKDLLETRPTVELVFKHYGLTYSTSQRKAYKDFFGKTPKQDEKDSLRSVVST